MKYAKNLDMPYKNRRSTTQMLYLSRSMVCTKSECYDACVVCPYSRRVGSFTTLGEQRSLKA